MSVPDDAPEDTFKLIVRGGGEVEEFENLSTKRGRQNAVTVVNAQSKLIRLEEATTRGQPPRPDRGPITMRRRQSPPR